VFFVTIHVWKPHGMPKIRLGGMEYSNIPMERSPQLVYIGLRFW